MVELTNITEILNVVSNIVHNYYQVKCLACILYITKYTIYRVYGTMYKIYNIQGVWYNVQNIQYTGCMVQCTWTVYCVHCALCNMDGIPPMRGTENALCDLYTSGKDKQFHNIAFNIFSRIMLSIIIILCRVAIMPGHGGTI